MKLRHRASQGFAAIGLVAAACLLLLNPLAWFGRRANAEVLRARLVSEVDGAVERSRLAPEQRRAFRQAGLDLKALLQARRLGESVDRTRVDSLRQSINEMLDSGAFRPEDRARINQLMEDLRSAARAEQARLRRETLVRQLGLPLGLLADWAVSQHGS